MPVESRLPIFSISYNGNVATEDKTQIVRQILRAPLATGEYCLESENIEGDVQTLNLYASHQVFVQISRNNGKSWETAFTIPANAKYQIRRPEWIGRNRRGII